MSCSSVPGGIGSHRYNVMQRRRGLCPKCNKRTHVREGRRRRRGGPNNSQQLQKITSHKNGVLNGVCTTCYPELVDLSSIRKYIEKLKQHDCDHDGDGRHDGTTGHDSIKKFVLVGDELGDRIMIDKYWVDYESFLYSTTDGMDLLIEGLKANITINEIHMNGCSYFDTTSGIFTMNILKHIISSSSSLPRRSSCSCSSNNSTMLKVLSLVNCNIDDGMLKSIAFSLQETNKNTVLSSLEVLDLSNNNIQNVSCFATILLTQQQRQRQQQAVSSTTLLHSNNMSTDETVNISNRSNNILKQHINLSHNKLGNIGINDVLVSLTATTNIGINDLLVSLTTTKTKTMTSSDETNLRTPAQHQVTNIVEILDVSYNNCDSRKSSNNNNSNNLSLDTYLYNLQHCTMKLTLMGGLRVLKLRGNHIGCNGIKALMSGLMMLRSIPTDKDDEKCCSSQLLSTTTTTAATTAAATTTSLVPCLEELDLGDNNIGYDGAIWIKTFLQSKYSSSLKKLDLNTNKIGNFGVNEICLGLMDNVVHCHSKNCHRRQGEEVFAPQPQPLLPSSSATLEILDMGSNGIGGLGIIAVIQMLKKNQVLKEIRLNKNQIDSDSIRKVIDDYLIPSRTDWYDVNEDDTSHKHKVGRRRTLDLRRNCIGNCAYSQKVLTEFIRECNAYGQFTKILLADNQIGDDCIISLADALKRNNDGGGDYIEVLDIGNCGILANGTIAIGEMLRTNHRSLKSINITGYLLPSKRKSQALTTASGGEKSSPVDRNGAIGTLLDGLKHNEYIQELHCWIEDELLRNEMNYYQNINKSCRPILKHDGPVPLGLWPYVLANMNCDPNLLLYLLREKPDLLKKR